MEALMSTCGGSDEHMSGHYRCQLQAVQVVDGGGRMSLGLNTAKRFSPVAERDARVPSAEC